MTPREQVELEGKWLGARKVRDNFINQTDWTQIPDAPLTSEKKAEFTTYRQALRDIPQTYDNPDDIVLEGEGEGGIVVSNLGENNGVNAEGGVTVEGGVNAEGGVTTEGALQSDVELKTKVDDAARRPSKIINPKIALLQFCMNSPKRPGGGLTVDSDVHVDIKIDEKGKVHVEEIVEEDKKPGGEVEYEEVVACVQEEVTPDGQVNVLENAPEELKEDADALLHKFEATEGLIEDAEGGNDILDMLNKSADFIDQDASGESEINVNKDKLQTIEENQIQGDQNKSMHEIEVNENPDGEDNGNCQDVLNQSVGEIDIAED